MSETTAWYIVKSAAGTCQIIAAESAPQQAGQDHWGPFNTQGEAIAKRVGLIRAGKCQPE